VANQMVKEGKLHKDLLNLDALEIAHEMTRKVCVCVCVHTCACCSVRPFTCPSSLQQSEIYQGIDPAEFVNFLYKLQDSIGTERIDKFQQVRVCMRACALQALHTCNL